MQYPETLEQSKDFARAAIRTMQQHQIAPNPVNYTIWYTYETGARPDLERTVDGIVEGGTDFSEEQCQELYRRFFSFETENDEVNKTSERIQDAVSKVLEFFDAAQSDANDFGRTLEGVSEQISGSHSVDEIGDLVRSIVTETDQMVQRSQRLEAEIAQSSQQVNELREHLREVRQEAMTDPLTGIANRKCFDARLRAAASESDETGEPMCLLIADIDHFKAFNDTFGHPVGDKVLRTVARALRDGLKGRDTSARYGGEEFAIVLPQTALNNAATVADQIRGTLANHQIVNRESGEIFGTVTLSIGVARYRSGEPLSALIQRADAALYRAKANGRNRVEVEGEASLSVVQ